MMPVALPPPTLITGAAVWIDDGRVAKARPKTAIALRDGRILEMGSEKRLLKKYAKAERVVLPGGTLLPGLIEGHAHVEGLGLLEARINFSGLSDFKEVLEKIKSWSEKNPDGWIQGRGWDQNLWEKKEFPSAKDLDAVTGQRPAALDRVDGHALWVNSAALALSGVTAKTPDPEGGRILRDSQGQPTGILIDAAKALVTKVIASPTLEQRKARLQSGLLALQKLGFTSVADMGCDKQAQEAYGQLMAAGSLPIRVFAYAFYDKATFQAQFSKPKPQTLSFYQVQGVKCILDGALGSRGARMIEAYADEPSTHGFWINEPAFAKEVIQRTLSAGYQPAVHAIGDAANHELLKLAETLSPLIRQSRLKIRDEHSQIVLPEDAGRFGTLGLIASLQPNHLADDHAWTPKRLGEKRFKEAFPWRTLAKGGALICFGSDAPASNPNPFLGLATAETRQDAKGQPPGGFNPQQRLTRTEAIRAYTLGNAQALGYQTLGVIKAGAAADLLWVNAPIMALEPKALRNLKPGRLWVNGREVPMGL